MMKKTKPEKRFCFQQFMDWNNNVEMLVWKENFPFFRHLWIGGGWVKITSCAEKG